LEACALIASVMDATGSFHEVQTFWMSPWQILNRTLPSSNLMSRQ